MKSAVPGLCAWALVACALNSAPTQAAKGYSWAQVAQWPDFTTGFWADGGGAVGAPGAGPGGMASNIPFTTQFQAAAQARRKKFAVGVGTCEPLGVIADSGSAFYFSRDVIVIGGLSDWYNVWRRVYMDGRGHDHPEPSYFGHSIGHWEGKTLVIDTVAIRGEAQVMQGMPVDNDDTHLVERFRLLDQDTLELTKTVENPAVFTKPWVSTRTFRRNVTEEYYESYCWTDRDAVAGVNINP